MSAVPAAISALVAVLDAATTATVYDGEPADEVRPDNWIAVGWQEGSDVAVTSDLDWSQLGNQRLEETFEILCSLEHHSGAEADPAGCRTATFALLTTVRTAVAADYTLGAAVRISRVAGFDYAQDQDNQGVTGSINFRVACAARLP